MCYLGRDSCYVPEGRAFNPHRWGWGGIAPQGKWGQMSSYGSLHVPPAWEALEKREGLP